jgi:uncharacterized protein (AIM24 family)
METALSDVSSAMKRFMTGQNLFVTDFTYQHGTKKEGTVALGTDFHSKILRLHLPDYPDQTLVCQKGAYLASNPDVNIEMAFTKNFASGFFGGQGFVLQKLEGDGDVLIKAGGTLVTKELKEGEALRVTSGSLVAFTATVDYGALLFVVFLWIVVQYQSCYASFQCNVKMKETHFFLHVFSSLLFTDVQMIKGAKNVIFGGEGLFITTLKGPGTVWLQGMPPDRMISEIARRMPPGGLGFGIPIGMGGGGGGGEGGGGGVAGEDVSGTEGVGGEAGEGVAATDAAVEADRQATVASSGVMSDDDPESPSALFGDAAPNDAAAAPDLLQEESAFGQDSWNGGEQTFSEDAKSDDDGFGEESFSTEDAFQDGDGGFQEDTSFSTFEESASDVAGDAAEGGGSSIFSTLWDFFTGGDD